MSTHIISGSMHQVHGCRTANILLGIHQFFRALFFLKYYLSICLFIFYLDCRHTQRGGGERIRERSFIHCFTYHMLTIVKCELLQPGAWNAILLSHYVLWPSLVDSKDRKQSPALKPGHGTASLLIAVTDAWVSRCFLDHF